MRRIRTGSPIAVVVAVCLLITSPRAAHAQERKGFWFDADFGAGSVGVSAGNFDASRTWTGVVGVSGGWAVSPHVLVGLDTRVAVLDVVGSLPGTFELYNLGAGVSYYPRVSSGLFVRGSIGGSFVDVSLDAQGTTLTANLAKGLGLGGGVGYDIYLGRGFSLTPAVTYWYGRPGDLRFTGQTVFPEWSHDVIDMTIGLSFH